jgi:hypothetical protein
MSKYKLSECKRGHVLPNGSTLIDKRKHHFDKSIDFVLAMNLSGVAQPFVTWTVFQDDARSTSNGHYFERVDHAATDFYERSY